MKLSKYRVRQLIHESIFKIVKESSEIENMDLATIKDLINTYEISLSKEEALSNPTLVSLKNELEKRKKGNHEKIKVEEFLKIKSIDDLEKVPTETIKFAIEVLRAYMSYAAFSGLKDSDYPDLSYLESKIKGRKAGIDAQEAINYLLKVLAVREKNIGSARTGISQSDIHFEPAPLGKRKK
jgi:hypothetical protein